MKFVAIRTWYGEIAVIHLKTNKKRKLINRVLKEIKNYLSSEDSNFEIVINKVDESSKNYEFYKIF